MKFAGSQVPKLLLILAGTLLLVASPPSLARAQEAEIPEPLGHVSDYAEVIDQALERKLDALLTELEEKTTAEVAVLTIKTTDPLDIFDYGMKVFDSWKIGKVA